MTDFSTIRLAETQQERERELTALRAELRQAYANLTATQTRCTELLEERRALLQLTCESDVTTDILAKVARERARQDHTWSRTPGNWPDPTATKLAVLIEEVGEVGKAICEGEPLSALKAELVQVAAVAVCWAEAVEREANGG